MTFTKSSRVVRHADTLVISSGAGCGVQLRAVRATKDPLGCLVADRHFYDEVGVRMITCRFRKLCPIQTEGKGALAGDLGGRRDHERL